MSLEKKTVREQIVRELCRRTLELYELVAKAYIEKKNLQVARVKLIIADLNRLAEVLP